MDKHEDKATSFHKLNGQDMQGTDAIQRISRQTYLKLAKFTKNDKTMKVLPDNITNNLLIFQSN